MAIGPDLDRCAGVILGLAAGDALGAGHEFGTPPSGDASMKGGGLGGWQPGEWTDDTQMAIWIRRRDGDGHCGSGQSRRAVSRVVSLAAC
jgi:hypothetical protein